ncbi:MAG: AraC family transcriptional regulator [Lachnospiraceae bacterium]|nr:AraC family transcriptional regulator [Lachnospiraceae bacterium]
MVIIRDSKKLNPEFPVRIDIHDLKRSDNDEETLIYSEAMELSVIENGEGVFITGGEEHEVKPGDLVIFNNAEPHRWDVRERELELLQLTVSMDFVSPFSYTFPESILRSFIEKGSNFLNLVDGKNPNSVIIHTLMQEIYREATIGDDGHELLISADVLKIITLLFRYFKADKTAVGGGKLFSEKTDAIKDFAEILNYINSHYKEKVSLDETADRIKMNPAYFSNYFKRIIGISFSEYLSVLRIRRACELKETSDMSMTEIAAECGFRNISNFYRIYKKYAPDN